MLDGLEPRQRFINIAEQDALGNFEGQSFRCNAVTLESVGDG